MKKYFLVLVSFFVFSIANAQTAAIKKVSAKELKAIIDASTTPLIVNFWASWCAPCIHELPYFESNISKADKPVKLLLVSLDFPEAYPKQLSAFVNKQGYKSEIVYLNETNADYFIPIIDPKWSGAIPASIFVNKSKNYYQFFNTQLTEPRFVLELKKLVE